jgi:hypothetical protein
VFGSSGKENHARLVESSGKDVSGLKDTETCYNGIRSCDRRDNISGHFYVNVSIHSRFAGRVCAKGIRVCTFNVEF